MLHAQFPSSDLRARLHLAIIDKTLRDLQDAKTAVLVVKARARAETKPDLQPESQPEGLRNEPTPGDKEPSVQGEKVTQEEEIISYARWILPSEKEEGYVEPPWRLPEGTDWGVLNGWTKLVEQADERQLRGKPCYRE